MDINNLRACYASHRAALPSEMCYGLMEDTFMISVIFSLLLGMSGAILSKRCEEYSSFGRWAWSGIIIYIIIIYIQYIYFNGFECE